MFCNAFLKIFYLAPQVPWLHAIYAVIGAILFTLVGVDYFSIALTYICIIFFSFTTFILFVLLSFATVLGLRHPAAVREQALRHKSRGVYFCHPHPLPGHHLPVQLPAPDHWRRPRVKQSLHWRCGLLTNSTWINLPKVQRCSLRSWCCFCCCAATHLPNILYLSTASWPIWFKLSMNCPRGPLWTYHPSVCGY